MKKIVLMAAFLLGVCVSVALAEDSTTYTSSSINNFAVTYPSNWTVQEAGPAVIFFTPLEDSADKFRENVNVFVEDLSKKPMTFEEYLALTEQNGPKLIKGFHLIDKGPSLIGSQKAELIVYEGEVNGNHLKFRAYTFMRDGDNSKAYTVTYTAFPNTYNQYLADAENIMQSIVLR